jgi:hypothetical protein
MIIREMERMRCVWLNSTVTCIVVGVLNRLEFSPGPTARAVEQLPIRENERASRQVANQDFISEALVASEVVTDVELESISPDFPNLYGGKQR